MREFTKWDAALGFVMLGVLAYLACATAPRQRVILPPSVTVIYQKVPCMDPPPAVPVPTWPTPDHLGNFVMHESTAELVKGQIYTLDKYVAEQYIRCREAAK